jgi:cytochrome P450
MHLEGQHYDLKDMANDFLGVFFGGNETTARSVVAFAYRMYQNPEIL